MTALRLERFSYRYPEAEAPSLVDCSLSVEAGEFVVVAGLTGSGKSTLLRAASGLVPHFHGGEAAGHAVVCGFDTREHGPAEIAAVAGTLFQDPETQVVLGTVRAELAFPLENRGLPPAAVARGVEEAALALGIEALLDRSTAELSGGELQRVALGASLAGRPRLVLLDEPTSQLDPVAGDELVWLLRRLNEEQGTTILLAEHRLERCLSAADRVLAFDSGRLACDAAPGEFLAWAVEHAPALATPAARLFAEAGLRPLPAGVKQARAALRGRGFPDESPPRAGAGAHAKTRPTHPPHPRGEQPVVRLRNVWHELRGGRAILRGAELALAPGERVALLGRNGAGKSTLLRHAKGLMKPTRGKVERNGTIALLLQNPGDYLLDERVDAELARAAGLPHAAGRHPRDLSGGERQRLALAIVTAPGPGGDPGGLPGRPRRAGADPGALLLDEPTRGMDRAAKGALAADLRERAERGTAVLVATHDTEFAAAFAERAVLLADGRVIADGAPAEMLAGGWYFATETARVLGGAGGALLPAEGAALIAAHEEAIA